MGVNSKGKRKLKHNERSYYWYVQQDAEDFGRINLKIVSEDKKFIISYQVGQSNNVQTPHIVIEGLEFEGLEEDLKRLGWIRVQTPIWNDSIITPSLVKTIFEWCLKKKDQLIFVDWKGDIMEIVVTDCRYKSAVALR